MAKRIATHRCINCIFRHHERGDGTDYCRRFKFGITGYINDLHGCIGYKEPKTGKPENEEQEEGAQE